MNRTPLVLAALFLPFSFGTAQAQQNVIVVDAPPQAQVPRRVVVVRQAPPPPRQVIVVRRPPPPPQRQVIVVQEPRRQVVYQQQPAQQIIVQQPPAQQVIVHDTPAPKKPAKNDPTGGRKFGLHAHVGGLLTETVQIGGISGALRIRPMPHFAIDLGAGYYAGTDYVGDDREEIPITANLLFFVNPQHKFQLYFLVGGGGSLARKTNPEGEVRDLAYAGGEAGVGFEWRIKPAFAINTDVRGFVRHRIDGDPTPEFTDGFRSTDTSFGGIITAGMTVYF